MEIKKETAKQDKLNRSAKDKEQRSLPFITSAKNEAEAIALLFGDSAAVVNERAVGDGDINICAVLELSNKQQLFAKRNSARYENMFYKEALGLVELRTEGGPAVPMPYAAGSNGKQQFILMEYFPQTKKGGGYARSLGRGLAAVHAKTAPLFGLDHDNFIGRTRQPNRQEKKWLPFFQKERLGFQKKLAEKQRLLPTGLSLKIEKLIEKLPQFLTEPKAPSLLHGDLWSGNAIASPDGNGALIDPAVYYGDPEADLAMTELFSPFPADFYNAYKEIRSIDSGYAERKHLYNLYHLLNHLNLFGSGYLSSVERIVGKYL